MKEIFIAVIIILITGIVNAQTAAPKELTCTEEAFNFSISLGSRWKLSTPKMGPAELVRNDPGFIPGWSFKVNHAATQTPAQPLFEQALRSSSTDYVITHRNFVPLANPYSLKIVDKLKNILPGTSLVGTYGTQPPDFNAGGATVNQHL